MVVTAPNATDDQLASIDDAIAMWHANGVAGLVRGEVPAVTIEFHEATESIYGFYDDTTATLYVNRRLVDRSQRSITLAHELGHALGLVHVSPDTRISVMNPGNLRVPPNESDAAALTRLWGACPGAP